MRKRSIVFAAVLSAAVGWAMPWAAQAQTAEETAANAKLNNHAPEDPQPPDTDQQRIADLVLASHILANEGVLDGFGHVTVRSKSNPNHYFMPRAMPPALITAKDIVELDLDSKPIDPHAPRTNGERFIHGEIYKVRPDVQAVVHAHTQAVIPFTLSKNDPLRPVLHMAGFLDNPVPVFEPRDVSKMHPEMTGKLQVNNAIMGHALALKLGQSNVILMRSHGDTVVGQTMKWAVYRAVYTKLDAEAYQNALELNKNVTTMNPAELKMHKIEVFDVQRPWDYWKSRVPANSPK